MIESVKIFYFIFGTFALIGGLIGYLKAKSVASLIAGAISSALLDFAAVLLVFYPNRPICGLGLGLIVTLALLGRFLPAFIKQRKMMPAGLMTILGSISLVLSVAALLQK